MLFRKKIPKDCCYCKHATKVEESNYLCAKKGIIFGDNPCRKFKYDPCKRIPLKAKVLDFQKFDENDFKL